MCGGWWTQVRHSICVLWCPTEYCVWPSSVPPVHKWPALHCIVAGETLCWRLPQVQSHESRGDQEDFQSDLDALQQWGDAWGMCFKAKKCHIMRINRSTKPQSKFYYLSIISEANCAKYLGGNIINDLEWPSHTSGLSSRPNLHAGLSGEIPGAVLRSLKRLRAYPW